jgi:hypothetical protein
MSRQFDMDTHSQAGDWITRTARRNPEALLLMAAGAALLLRSGGSTRRHSADAQQGQARPHVSDEVTRSASQVTDTAAGYATDLKDRVSNTASHYAAKVSEFAGETGRSLSEGSERFARQAHSTMQGAVDRVLRDQPLAVAAAGLAAGALVAAMFPSSEIESRTLGSAHEALTDVVDKARETVVDAVGKAGEHLKSAAEDRGLTSEGLKDLAGDVADTFTDAMSGKSTANKQPRMVADSPSTADFGVSGLGSEKRPAADERVTVGPSGGAKR